MKWTLSLSPCVLSNIKKLIFKGSCHCVGLSLDIHNWNWISNLKHNNLCKGLMFGLYEIHMIVFSENILTFCLLWRCLNLGWIEGNGVGMYENWHHQGMEINIIKIICERILTSRQFNGGKERLFKSVWACMLQYCDGGEGGGGSP